MAERRAVSTVIEIADHLEADHLALCAGGEESVCSSPETEFVGPRLALGL